MNSRQRRAGKPILIIPMRRYSVNWCYYQLMSDSILCLFYTWDERVLVIFAAAAERV